jgi:hypothetical protein
MLFILLLIFGVVSVDYINNLIKDKNGDEEKEKRARVEKEDDKEMKEMFGADRAERKKKLDKKRNGGNETMIIM